MSRKIRLLYLFWSIYTITAVLIATPEYCCSKEFSPETLLEGVELDGFTELRTGFRTRKDEAEQELSVMEARLQLELFRSLESMDIKYKADFWADGVTEQGEYDTREAWLFNRIFDNMDLKIGRQVLTWGTGDLVFLNDLFPKDWQSFFIGRADEYLKAPSDALKCSLFTNFANVDLVYTPQFDPDRYVTGEYLSFWNKKSGALTGQDISAHVTTPDDWFRDDELAFRIYKTINSYEVALYGYFGFWKQPSGQDSQGGKTFPALNVYGASIRGQLGVGIGNLEIAYYDSRDDSDGTNSLIENSQIRYLAGYTWELAPEFTAGFQYYIEQILDYDTYQKGLTAPALQREQFRNVLISRFTKLLMQQTLTLSLAVCFSPTDMDTYIRPRIEYQHTDNLILETGANIFLGRDTNTFFAQFENNTNLYVAVRYYF